MGAAGSVESGSGLAQIEDISNTTSSAVEQGSQMVAGLAEVPNAEAAIAGLLTTVVAEQREAVSNMLATASQHMDTDQIASAIKTLDGLEAIEGAAVLAVVAGGFQAASDMAPAVMASFAESLAVVGGHLPYIGVACGAIGAIAATFKLSKDQDKNVETVTLWTSSVKDWLIMVVKRVEKSAAESTLPLFQALQDALLVISEQMSSRNRKWRVSKMLSSATFQRDFGNAKTTVLDLKNALHDFLDQESQDAQEEMLTDVSNAVVETNEKLDSMNDQLGQIKAMLDAQVEEKEAAKNNDQSVKDEEEQIYMNLKKAADVEGDVPFKRFILAFETFFYAGEDMPPEQRRALKLQIDKDGSGEVSKPEWVKFYRTWTKVDMNVEEYLLKIAADNPTATQIAYQKAAEARVEMNKRMSMAKDMAGDAAKVGAGLMEMGKGKMTNMMGGGIPKMGFGSKK
ncbi:hypothetical protein TrLO_g3730 [Triparma laevis f. longispina]|uniref:EF-hand domain-containing protein n=1 Tax=Triparma laevis f. longispina TaxID=1714387 RepID=A0A9W7F8C2_9STRA|nr:hypothetical protein TrLO_g3730 [Triparma laevis f. longispina]